MITLHIVVNNEAFVVGINPGMDACLVVLASVGAF